MYAVWTFFKLGPGMREVADKLSDEFAPLLSSRKGFKTATMFGDDSVGEYGGLTVWETKEDAEATMRETEPQIREALKDVVKGEPIHRLFEVWEVF
jgi:hypothetical protein